LRPAVYPSARAARTASAFGGATGTPVGEGAGSRRTDAACTRSVANPPSATLT